MIFLIAIALIFFIIGFIMRALEKRALKLACKMRYAHIYNADYMIHFAIGTWIMIMVGAALISQALPFQIK